MLRVVLPSSSMAASCVDGGQLEEAMVFKTAIENLKYINIYPHIYVFWQMQQ